MRVSNETTKERIRKLRTDAGLTGEELAKKLDIPQRSISKFETGKNSLSEYAIIKYCKYFGCTSDYLLGIDDMPTKKSTDIARETGLSHEAIEALRKMKKHKGINQSRGEKALQVINFLLEKAFQDQQDKRKKIKYGFFATLYDIIFASGFVYNAENNDNAFEPIQKNRLTVYDKNYPEDVSTTFTVPELIAEHNKTTLFNILTAYRKEIHFGRDESGKKNRNYTRRF